jgi:hypothetical protein
MWPWLLMPLVTLALFCMLEKLERMSDEPSRVSTSVSSQGTASESDRGTL